MVWPECIDEGGHRNLIFGTCSVCSTGVLRRCDQPFRFDYLRSRYPTPRVLFFAYVELTPLASQNSRMPLRRIGEENRLSTSGMDGNISSTTILRFGHGIVFSFASLPCPCRSMRIVQLPLERVTEDMPLSMSLRQFHGTATRDVLSWIQSNPEFGFGFKALVCHDGVCSGRMDLVRD